MPVMITNANFTGLPCCLSLANGILLKASTATIKMASCIICGKLTSPIKPPNAALLNHSSEVSTSVEKNNDKKDVL